MSGTSPQVPFSVWRSAGTTEHIGGVFATRRLLGSALITPGQDVLDIGCGTGYTACWLAQTYDARIVALDLLHAGLVSTGARAQRAGVRAAIALSQADAHHLPFQAQSFDHTVAESVLIFCDAERVLAEMYRVTRPGGMIFANELTLLQPPPPELEALLTDTLEIRPRQEAEWRALFTQAGYTDVACTIHRIRIVEQLASHVMVDGIGGYLRAMVKGLSNRELRGVFINRRMLSAWRRFLPVVGYGLYVARKL